MLIDTVNEGVRFRISSQPISQRASLEDLRPSFLPEGYELMEEDNHAGVYWVFYQNELGDRLDVRLSSSGRFDTERAELEALQIHGLPAYIVDQTGQKGDNHGIVKVIVINEVEGYILSVISAPHSNTTPTPISRDNALRIAESLFE